MEEWQPTGVPSEAVWLKPPLGPHTPTQVHRDDDRIKCLTALSGKAFCNVLLLGFVSEAFLNSKGLHQKFKQTHRV